MIVVLYGGSLRGNEGFMVDAEDSSEKIILTGKNTETPHILVPLYGFFKNEQGERFLSSITKSGIKIRFWLEQISSSSSFRRKNRKRRSCIL